jgi:MFS transporter, PAT family, beta-lactamase induction signal transducer AmpG
MAGPSKRRALPILPAVAVLGFTSGLPLSLTDSTLKACLSGAGIDIKLIGLLGLIGLPYSLKFLWSPLLDRFVPPFGGRRRGWIVLVELALFAGLIGMAHSDPKSNLAALCLIALLVAFFSATADIAIDAYRTELLPERQASMGAGLHVGAYRVAMLAAGAFALWLSDRVSWRIVYLVMAGLLVPGILGCASAPDPIVTARPRTLRQAVVEPFRDLVSRRRAWEVLVFVAVFKLGDVFASSLTVPFLKDLGFTNTQIGLATKGVGLGCLIGGGLAGGALMRRWTLGRALWIFGLIQAGANLLPCLLARAGHVHLLMLAVIGGENLCWGLGTTAYTTLLMRLCDRRNTATQYAVLSSLMALSRTVLASPAGWIKAAAGWQGYFLFAATLAVPGLILLRRFPGWQLPETEPADGESS